VKRPRQPLSSSLRGLLVVVVALLVLPAAALGQCPQTTLGDVEDEVMCPVCGVPLELATEAPQANRQREFIVERVERCESKEEIKAALVAEFGQGVLATPGDDGADLAAYLLPALGVVAGIGAIALAIVRWRWSRIPVGGKGPAAQGSAESTASPQDSARLNRDLERYDL
jgi:cytochrome c-type biogenesis protein CcmH